jgi:uncharacterized protein (TIGR02145 family)
MKNIFFYLLLCSSLFSDAQTQQNINKNTGTVANSISTIDSIRFTGSSSIMEVVLENGTVESHSISDIINVDFAASQSQHSCSADSVHNPNLIYGNMTDQEGNLYKTIVIGSQEWMAENLKTSVYRNGETISNITDSIQWSNLTTGAWAYYKNDSLFECPFGKLYNSYAVTDPRHLCPIGWHEPTNVEWTILTGYLGGEATCGGKLKSTSVQYWISPNQEATNESGFSALPSGYRISYGFYATIGYGGFWWSSSVFSDFESSYIFLGYLEGNYSQFNCLKQNGLNVRCLKD